MEYGRKKWLGKRDRPSLNVSAVICSISMPALFIMVLVFQYFQGEKSLHLTVVMSIFAGFVSILMIKEINHYKEWTKNMAISMVLLNVGMYVLLLATSAFGPQHEALFYLVPIAAYSILSKRLISERYAVLSAVWMAWIGASVFHVGFSPEFMLTAIYFLISQLVAVYFFTSFLDRVALLKTASTLFLVHVILIVSFTIPVATEFFTWDLMLAILFAGLSVIVSVVLALGLLPLFEAGFNLLTESRLLNLSNPNHPLLKKVLVEAPGTYHHSVMVANLSESACEAIGANGLLARVAAYYHDIGKAFRPDYFIENQQNISNPHDELDPKESAKIILAHAVEGAEVLKEYKLPQEIIDITKQHHGTTLLKYFYYKEKEQNPEVNEKLFRYAGPIPQTKEAAVINICDSVEAAVRSKKNPTKSEIRKLVRSIINSRLTDGQLDESQLAISDLKKIENSICHVLSGIFHERIEYPSEKKQSTERIKEAR